MVLAAAGTDCRYFGEGREMTGGTNIDHIGASAGRSTAWAYVEELVAMVRSGNSA